MNRPGGAGLYHWRLTNEDGGSYEAVAAQSQWRLEAQEDEPPYVYDLFCKASVVSHRAGHVVYEPAGTP